jgi:hypothetical protein
MFFSSEQAIRMRARHCSSEPRIRCTRIRYNNGFTGIHCQNVTRVRFHNDVY